MSFVNYSYGSRKKEMIKLLRARASLKEKVYYHQRKIVVLREQIIKAQLELESLEALIKRELGGKVEC